MAQIDDLVEQLKQQGERSADMEGLNESLPSRALRAIPRAVADLATPLVQGDQTAAVQSLLGRQFGPTKEQFTPPTAGSTAAGIAGGLLKGPLTGRLLQGPLDMVAGREGEPPTGARERAIGALDARFEGTRGYAIGTFGGEEGPGFIGSLKLMSAGRSLVELAVERAAPRIAERVAATRVGSLVRESEKLTAFLETTSPKGTNLPSQVGQYLRRTETAPLSYRIAQGVGNVAGFSSYTGLEASLDTQEGDDVGTVGSRVMGAAGVAALVETAIVGSAAVVSRFGRRVNLAEALANWQRTIAEPGAVQVERRALRTKFNDNIDALATERLALEQKRTTLETAKQLQVARQAQLGEQQATLAKRSDPKYQARATRQIELEAARQEAQIPASVVRGPLVERDAAGLVRGRVEQAASGVAKTERALVRGEARIGRATANVESAQERVVNAHVEAAQSENALAAWNEGWVFYPENTAALNRTLPYNPKGAWRQIQQWLLSTRGPVAKSPQDFAGKLGLSGVRLTSQLGRSEADATVGAARATDTSLQALNEAAALRGLGTPRDGMFMEEAVDMFVKGRDAELVAQYGQSTFDHLERLSKYAESQYERLVTIGARPKMSPEQLEKLGVKRYWPQVVEDVDEDVFRERLLESFRREVRRDQPKLAAADVDLAAQKQLANFERHREGGLAGHGSFDEGRFLAGSTVDKVAKGLPFIRDPYRAMEDYLVGIERKYAFGTRWGYKGELADAAVQLVKAEGGSEHIAQAITDIFFKRKPASMAARRMAEYATSAQVAAKMPFSAILNSGQSTHAVAIAGLHNTTRGLVDLTKREGIARLNYQVNLMQGLFKGLRDTQLGGYEGANWINRFVDLELRLVGFTPTERVNRLVAGAGFGHLVHDTISQAVTGRLRGINLEHARRLFSSKLDTDLDLVVRRLQQGGRLSENEFDRMVYRGAQLSQFMPDLTRRPSGWNTPTGRVVSQFSNFVLAQTHFMRNEILGEAARGNLAPLATIVALYPTVGEFMSDALGWAKERPSPRREPWRTIDSVTLMGGLGMVTSLGQAAWYNRLAEGTLGPTIGGTVIPTIESTVKFALSGDYQPLAQQFDRLPIVVMGNRALDVAEWSVQHFEEFQGAVEEGSPEPASNVDSIRLQRAADKGGAQPKLGVNVFQRPQRY